MKKKVGKRSRRRFDEAAVVTMEMKVYRWKRKQLKGFICMRLFSSEVQNEHFDSESVASEMLQSHSLTDCCVTCSHQLDSLV